jgi:alkylation response protein AidB-like acyl-CoA dehydrogenase
VEEISMADFGGADLDAFRAEARRWLEENFPASLRGADDMTPGEGPAAETDDRKRWKQAMADTGWGAPTWPRQYGGAELTGAQAVVLAEEMDRIGAYNPMAGMGVSMIGPTLLEYGTEDQKQRHLPPIVRGEIRWCQGYSEPGAGSDLASLQTRCEDAGDHWLVNGQKIWTSGAQYADWCFCLVRTDTSKKHEGISFVLIDMHQPGVEVRPIKLIAGHSPFCETFFTNARVEKNDMVGPLNGGWTVGKRLLQFERSGSSRPRSETGPAPAQLAKDYVGMDEKGRIADSDLRSRIAANDIDRHAFVLTQYRAIAEARGNQNPSATTSIMKNANTVITQQRQELLIEIMGHQGLGWDGDEFSDLEKTTVRSWLGGKATTIFAGSYEVQNNIISKRILGLPDTTQSN